MVAEQDLTDMETRLKEQIRAQVSELKDRYDEEFAALQGHKRDTEKKADEYEQDKIMMDLKMTKMEDKVEKLEKIKEQMSEMLDKKFSDEMLRYQELVVSARTEFEALNTKMEGIISGANTKFIDTDNIIKNAESKFNEVNASLNILYQSAQNKFTEIDQNMGN